MNIKEIDKEYVLGTYSRAPFVVERGEGVYLYDEAGKRYLDFVGGIAVNAYGYGDPDITSVIQEQSAKLIHASNLYLTEPQARLAQRLAELSFADKVFFCNSGAEANEAALKISRKWAKTTVSKEKVNIICFNDGFHGRTMGALALTTRESWQEPFAPLMPGARVADFNNLDSVKAVMDESVCAVFVEPIQGEGGVNVADISFIRGLRELCDEYNALLIFDEVQCGMGRTGTLWAYQQYEIEPDMMTLAKPLAGGIPMGAALMRNSQADVMQPGDHGSTFAGNALSASVALVILNKTTEAGRLEHIARAGELMRLRLNDLKKKHACIKSVRGKGLLIGIECEMDVSPIVADCYELGLITCKAGAKVLRLLPPYIIQETHINTAVDILDSAFAKASVNHNAD